MLRLRVPKRGLGGGNVLRAALLFPDARLFLALLPRQPPLLLLRVVGAPGRLASGRGLASGPVATSRRLSPLRPPPCLGAGSGSADQSAFGNLRRLGEVVRGADGPAQDDTRLGLGGRDDRGIVGLSGKPLMEEIAVGAPRRQRGLHGRRGDGEIEEAGRRHEGLELAGHGGAPADATRARSWCVGGGAGPLRVAQPWGSKGRHALFNALAAKRLHSERELSFVRRVAGSKRRTPKGPYLTLHGGYPARDDTVCMIGALRNYQPNCHPERERGTFDRWS